MARPPRSCFVYKPLHQYRYLPRPVYNRDGYDYEEMQAGPEHFENKIDDPPKLWIAWLYRKPRNELKACKTLIAETFGDSARMHDMRVFKNTPYWNDRLWRLKHLIEVKPVRFPHGEPTEEDLPFVRLLPNGQCLVDKRISNATLEQSSSTELAIGTERLLNRQLALKWKEHKEILEDSPWSLPNHSVV